MRPVAGHHYESTLEFWAADGKPKAATTTIRSTFPAMTPQRTIQQELELSQVAPGDYRLVLRIRDLTSGAEVVRERRLAVRK